MKKLSALFLLLLFILVILILSMKSQTAIGIFDHYAKIGMVKHNGTATYNPVTDQYCLTATGRNMPDDPVEFQFLCKKVTGDFILYTMLKWINMETKRHGKAGLMIRENLSPDSPYANLTVDNGGLVAFQSRSGKDSVTSKFFALPDFLSVLQFERTGDSIFMYASNPSNPLQRISQVTMKFNGDEAYIGLFVCSQHEDLVEKVAFMNTRLTFPARKGFVPYRDLIGSRLEVLNITNGLRKIIYESKIPFHAPNWSKDGKYLVVNSQGLLYRIAVTGGKLELINSGFADNNNNDHGISPNGKLLAISHFQKEGPEGSSLIYTLPFTGGKPNQVTSNSPSYWHGWSPDGEYLIYTAKRNNQMNIFRIHAEGGDETQLTNNVFLDDGPEYSTDGKFIWFNSNRSGTMEIWRMNSDGSDQQQITNDEYQNWFPHPSPNGKWIAFLSYPPNVGSIDHPFYKQVMIRIMKTDGSKLQVLSHLYGGQGSFNVPSWSPDSKMIAFVSNSDKIE